MQKFLRFPASAFTAGNQQLTLAAKNIYGEGQASAPFIYTHVVGARADSVSPVPRMLSALHCAARLRLGPCRAHRTGGWCPPNLPLRVPSTLCHSRATPRFLCWRRPCGAQRCGLRGAG